jgi:hypothetical protein
VVIARQTAEAISVKIAKRAVGPHFHGLRSWIVRLFCCRELKDNSTAMKNLKPNRGLPLLLAGVVTTLLVGCKEKSDAGPAFEKTKTSAQEAGDAIKDAAKKTGVVVKDAAKETGKAVESAAEKTWDGIKKGAQEVSHVATNVAGEVKTGAEKVGEKVKDAVK